MSYWTNVVGTISVETDNVKRLTDFLKTQDKKTITGSEFNCEIYLMRRSIPYEEKVLYPEDEIPYKSYNIVLSGRLRDRRLLDTCTEFEHFMENLYPYCIFDSCGVVISEPAYENTFKVFNNLYLNELIKAKESEWVKKYNIQEQV